MYWNENLPDKFFYWIDIFNNTGNDKYSNYLFSANCCVNYAKKTKTEIFLDNINYDYSTIKQLEKSEPYLQEDVQNFINFALLNGKNTFGVKLWDKAIECLDNAYQMKKTSEVLNFYYKIYMNYSKSFYISGYRGSTDDKVTSLYLTFRKDEKKAEQYLNLSLQLEENWETHYLYFYQRMRNEVNFHDGKYDEFNNPQYDLESWNVKNNLRLIQDIFKELNTAIDLVNDDNAKAKMIFEKGNLYFYSLRDYDKAKEEYKKALTLNYKTDFIPEQILNCDKQKQNDLIYSECATLLGLESIYEYFSYSSRTNYIKLYNYLMMGYKHEPYKYNDLIVVPEQKLSIIDLTYQDGYFVYLISSQCTNPLSKYCKVISPVQLNYFYYNEYLITDVLILKYIGDDVYRSYYDIEKCDLFENIVVGTDEYETILKILELNSQIIK